MKGIDPKYIMWLGLLVTVEQAIGHGTVDLTNLVPVTWAPYITSWCNFLAFVGTSIMTYQAAVSGPQVGPLVKLPENVTPLVVKVLIGAFALSMFLPIGSASAQGRFRPTGNLVRDIQNANSQVRAAVTGKPADPTAALPCMDIKMLVKLTPDNLVPTMKACVQDVNNQLVSDTQRALDSAKAYVGPNGGNPGDNDAVNCLTPALALFKAAAIIPAVPEVPAVLNADGSIKTPAVAAIPELDPGPILLFQKYREFVLAGALTSCQSWFNQPINATTAAGIGAVGTAVAGAAAVAGVAP